MVSPSICNSWGMLLLAYSSASKRSSLNHLPARNTHRPLYMQVAIYKVKRFEVFLFSLHLWPPAFYSESRAGHRVSVRLPVLGAVTVRCRDGVILAGSCLVFQEIREKIPLFSSGSRSSPSKSRICPYKKKLLLTSNQSLLRLSS